MRYALFFVFMSLPVFCAEAPLSDATTVPGDTALPGWLMFILSFEFVWKTLATLGGLLIVKLFGMWSQKYSENQAVKEAIDILKSAVQATYDEFVQEAKKASADGKLTLEEKKKAQQLAIAKAMELAKGPALQVLIKWGKPFLEGLVGQIVQKMKAGK